MSGTLTIFIARSRKALTSSTSSRSGSCRQTSITCAPLLTWARAISPASSNLPSAISRLNLRLPSTLVRSPTITGRLSSSISSVSMPETSVCVASGTRRGLRPAAAAASAWMCAGRRAAAAADEVHPALLDEAGQLRRQLLRRLVVLPVLVGQPRVRVAGGQRLASAARVRMWSVMKSGPVAQFRPTERSGACISDA